MDSKRFALVIGGVMLLTVCGVCMLCVFPAAFIFSPMRYAAQANGPQSSESLDASDMSGEALFDQYGCAACHRADGFGPGPVLAGLYNETVTLADGSSIIADETYLRRSILDSQAETVSGYPPIMPEFDGQISEEEADLLVEYIQSLGE